MSGYDIIRAEVLRKSMESIANEMAITLMRTSGSPVVTDAKDFSTTVLDRSGEQVGFSGYVAFHVSTSVLGIEAVLRQYDDVAPGDIILMNDPHTAGAIHQGDCAIAMSYWWRDRHVGWGHVNEHMLDIGGSSVSGFAPEARDCYSEALRFPPIRIGRNWQIDESWASFIGANVRVPDIVLNDLRSMVAAHATGQRRLAAVLDEAGLEEFDRYAAINKDLSEQVTRERIAAMADGEYTSRNWVEYDGHGEACLYPVSLTMEVAGDEISFRFDGAPQVDAFINATRPVVLGQTLTTLLCQLFYDVPVNAGFWRPFHFDLGPSGTIVNALPPAPVSQGHMETGMRINKLVCDAVTQALMASDSPFLRSRMAGEPANGSATTTLAGVDRRTGRATVMFPLSPPHCQGGGAQTSGDGQDTYGSQCTLGNGVPAVEIEESTAPMMVLWRTINANSGGAGLRRGGQGISMGIAIVGAETMRGTAFNAMAEIPARGAAGGLPGGASHYELVRSSNLFELLATGQNPIRERLDGERIPLPAKTGSLSVREGDVFVFTSGGGGGLGDPLLRDPADVGKDVADRYVTRAAARDLYGVVLNAEGESDTVATDSCRLQLRTERLGHAPTREAMMGLAWWSTGAVRRDGSWFCACCTHDLGEDYWSSAVAREGALADFHGHYGMQLRSRPDGEPQAVLRKYLCPACGYAVVVDVALAGDDVRAAPALRPC
jgi:N-methylhydantoinase B